MNERIKSYKGTITVETPVHIGDGRIVNKKDYIYDGAHKQVQIIDIPKLYMQLSPTLQEKFEYFYSGDRSDLQGWLKSNLNWSNKSQYENFIKYSMTSGTSIAVKDRGGYKLCEISSFIKDPYNRPYVPGSSIKGVLRSAILSQVLHENGEDYLDEIEILLDKAFGREKVRSDKFLKPEIKKLENAVFNSWLYKKRQGFKNVRGRDDAVNCCLSGLIVGDSASIESDKLIVVQKVDEEPKGERRALPIFRECLKPETKIEFMLTINSGLCPFTLEYIEKSLKTYFADQARGFYKKFVDGISIGSGCNAFLGGGAGFFSKTVTGVISETDGGNSVLETNDNIFFNTLSQVDRRSKKTLYVIHKHNLDKDKFMVSPHMRKRTRYQDRYVDMGRISLKFEEIEI